jgi:DNA end-binding protein Ku
MPARASSIWNGSVSFGLVTVPVAVLTAVRAKKGAFHMLHEKDGARLKRRMYCPADEEFVSNEHIIRGFEIEEGRHVIISDEEIRSIAPKRSNTIEIKEFVNRGDIVPAYYDRPYYLAPTGPEKPYRLLVEVMADLDVAGMSEVVMNAREKFCCVQSLGGALCLFTLRYPPEIRSADEIATDAEADSDDVDAMTRTMDKMRIKFEPGELVDEYEQRVEKLMERKKKKKQFITAPEIEEEETPAEEGQEAEMDLVSALEQSLAKERERAQAGR